MKVMTLLFCLVLPLIGCASAPKKNAPPPQPVQKNIALPPPSLPAQKIPAQNIQAVSEQKPVAMPAVPADEFCINPKELDNIIAIFSDAIARDPHYAGSYYNRASAYFYKKDYDKSWQDIHKAEALGITPDQKYLNLIEKLKKASGREK